MKREVPLITVVVAMYGVEQYLPAFLASLDAQGAALSEVEAVFVDDGSPDNSARLVSDWLRTTRVNALLISQQNGGVSAARNTGMAAAQGTWLTFADPDDVLDTAYFTAVITALADLENGEPPALVSTNMIFTDDTLTLRRDAHPLRSHFAHGRRVVDLTFEPQTIKLSAATSFVRRDEVTKRALKWDPRVRPNFEDGAFLAHYLLGFTQPRTLIVPEARYLYRKRTEATSLTTRSWRLPEKYVDVPRFGWLEPLRAAAARYGSVPIWLQNTILYDLYWYLHYDAQIHSPTRSISQSIRDEFLRLVRETLSFVDPETITAFSITRMSPQMRAVLLALSENAIPLSPIHVWRADKVKGLALIKYYFSGERPEELLHVGGKAVAPVYAKDRSITYFGQVVLYERILWLKPREPLGVRLNGQRSEIRYNVPGPIELAITAQGLRRRLGLVLEQPAPPSEPVHGQPPADQAAAADGSATGWPQRETRLARAIGTRRDLLGSIRRQLRKRRTQILRVVTGRSVWAKRPWAHAARRYAQTKRIGTRFADAWVLMDRDLQAQDNAEHLYRWIKKHRPGVNAWFVLRKGSSDWSRLRSEGFRLVNYGSTEHFMLLQNARFLVSSHIDQYVLQPWSTKLTRGRHWQFVFLQHGVTKDDISRWLNPKPLRLILATGEAEYRAFTANNTPYTFTPREVALTGFPRHDALLAKAHRMSPDDRDLIVIMPTWREYLMGPVTGRGTTRELVADFDESAYVLHWRRLLDDLMKDPALSTHGCRVGFVPHPSLEPHLDRLDIPTGVEVFRYRDHNIQDVITRARVLVTDYSSLAFEAAYIRTPVVYFQFDAAQFFEEHPHREGYFNYERDGFGPVALVAEEARAAIRDAMAHSQRTARYNQRAEDFFIERDGLNCERAFLAINDLSR